MAVRPIAQVQLDQAFELPAGTNYFFADLNVTIANTTFYPVAILLFQEAAEWWIRVQPETRHLQVAENITDLVHQPQRRMITVAPTRGPRPEAIAEGVARFREIALQAGQLELANNAEETIWDFARHAFCIQRH
jgi:hypothetical protein